MTCQEVQRELSNYLDRELPVEVYAEMQDHFRTCERCATLLQDTRDMVLALGDERLVDVPHGYSTRLYRKLRAQLGGPRSGVGRNVSTEIPLGITNDVVDLGSHLIYFWQSDEEFAQGVRFLEPGLLGEDHCIVFGHDEATERVYRYSRRKGSIPSISRSNAESRYFDGKLPRVQRLRILKMCSRPRYGRERRPSATWEIWASAKLLCLARGSRMCWNWKLGSRASRSVFPQSWFACTT